MLRNPRNFLVHSWDSCRFLGIPGLRWLSIKFCSPAEFDENAAHPIRDFSQVPGRSPSDSLFTYCNANSNEISQQLGIPWEPSKTVPFSFVVPYLCFEWNLSEHTVAIPKHKKAKYKATIEEWLPCQTHNPDEAQKLYSPCCWWPAGTPQHKLISSLTFSTSCRTHGLAPPGNPTVLVCWFTMSDTATRKASWRS